MKKQNVVPLSPATATVRVKDGRVVIVDYTITDPAMASYLERLDVEERVSALDTAIRIGFEALRHISPSRDALEVERRLQQAAEAVVAQIATASQEASKALTDSVPSLEQVVSRVVRSGLDASDPNTLAGSLRRDVTALSQEVATQLGYNSGAQAQAARGTQKGQKFEVEFGHVLIDLVGDAVPEYTANQTGNVPGCKVGDVVVDILHAKQPTGHKVVFEVKDKKMPLGACLKEVKEAMENRGACAGVVVFSSVALAPAHRPFAVYDDRAVIVFDKETKDAAALKLALNFAEWIAIRKSSSTVPEADRLEMVQLLEQAQRRLGDAAQVRRNLTSARNGVEQAAVAFDKLADGIATDMAAIVARLS